MRVSLLARNAGRLLLSMLMKLADISNIARPTPLAHKWAEILTVEFFNQGDQERKRGLVQTPIFDREKTRLAALQAGMATAAAGGAGNLLGYVQVSF